MAFHHGGGVYQNTTSTCKVIIKINKPCMYGKCEVTFVFVNLAHWLNISSCKGVLGCDDKRPIIEC